MYCQARKIKQSLELIGKKSFRTSTAILFSLLSTSDCLSWIVNWFLITIVSTFVAKTNWLHVVRVSLSQYISSFFAGVLTSSVQTVSSLLTFSQELPSTSSVAQSSFLLGFFYWFEVWCWHFPFASLPLL